MTEQNLLARQVFAAALVLSLGIGVTAQAETLLVDNFNDDWIDPAKWTTASLFAGSSVAEVNQRIELTNRGHLVTAGQYDPNAYPGGIKITGQWSFAELLRGDSSGNMRFLTRSDGVPVEQSGETQNGIDFGIGFARHGDSQFLTIGVRGTQLAIGVYHATGKLTVNAGTTYRFEIVDAGANLSFSMTELGAPSNTASATAVVTRDTFDQDFVVFHNREKNDTVSRTARLDNVRITAIAEPETPGLLASGGLMAVWLIWGRRRRCKV